MLRSNVGRLVEAVRDWVKRLGQNGRGLEKNEATESVAGYKMLDNDKPNVVYILTDQWRAKATGYNGDPNANTPHIDQLAKESVDFANAIGTSPVYVRPLGPAF